MNWLEHQIAARPEATALRIGPVSYTFADLGRRVSRMAAALGVAQLGPGSRITTLLGNTTDHVVTALAAMWTGATLVPINTRLSDEQVSWILADLEPDLLVLDAESATRELELGASRFVQVEQLSYSVSIDPVPFDLDGLATILYTADAAGPDARPRPVPLTWRNHQASAMASVLNLGVHRDDAWLCCLPLHDIDGLAVVLRCILYGITVELMDHFDARQAYERLIGGQVSLASLDSTMLRRVLHAGPGGDPDAAALALSRSPLRAMLVGGGRTDLSTLERCAAHGVAAYPTYGMIESASQITVMPAEQSVRRLGSAGLPVQGAELRIVDDDGRPVRPGFSGTIAIRGPMVTQGYLDDLDERPPGGWFLTGDRGRIDDEGFLWVESRRGDHVDPGLDRDLPALEPEPLPRRAFFDAAVSR